METHSSDLKRFSQFYRGIAYEIETFVLMATVIIIKHIYYLRRPNMLIWEIFHWVLDVGRCQ